MTDILNLPWQIQVSLASGYAGYMLACFGVRENHRAIDTTFMTLVFGLFASAALYLLDRFSPVIAGTVALVLTLVVAALWRGLLRSLFDCMIRKFNVSWTNNDPSALHTMFSGTTMVSQISVLTDDGTWLECRNNADFSAAPTTPCIIGTNGDVMLYVTHREEKGQNEQVMEHVIDDRWGYQATYIPASRIREMKVRFVKN